MRQCKGKAQFGLPQNHLIGFGGGMERPKIPKLDAKTIYPDRRMFAEAAREA